MTVAVLLNLGLLVIAVALLWKGAEWVVESAAAIAATLGISELVIGLTVVAFGTSAPEFAVTVGAALKGHADISVANIVGSNIFNLGFILGGVAAIRGIRTQARLVYRDGGMLILAASLLLFFLRDLHLARAEGVFMFLLLGVYLTLLLVRREALEPVPPHQRARWNDGLVLVLGLAAVVLGGHWLVESASFLAAAVGMPEWVIGVTIVAAGTSAPEFFTSLVAAVKGRHGISAGNLIGSDLFNQLGVLGLAGMLRPLTVEPAARGSLVALLAMVVLAVVFMRTGWRLSRREGVFLVALNAIRWVLDFWFHH